jgi:hypothetical protein
MIRRRVPDTATAAVLVALPNAVAVAIVLVFVAAELIGATPFSYRPPANLAEAAGMGIASEVLRYLRQGEEPGQVMPVRPDIISSEVTQVTALEAAIWSRRVQVVRLFERQGALSDPSARQHVACLSAYLRADEILEDLAPDGLAGCDPAGTFEAIKARSPQAP